MRIQRFIWLDKYVEKLEVKHGVLPEEVEEVFENRPKFRKVAKGYTVGEDVYNAIGSTFDGRYLFVIFIRKAENRALIVSARDATTKERRRYAK